MNTRYRTPWMDVRVVASVAGLLLTAALADARAQDVEPPADPAIAAPATIQYLSGGVGATEADAIKAESAHYALTVTFAQRSGGRDVYLAAVPVVIRDEQGKVLLDLVTEGPYLLVNLPQGHYQVVAQHDGVEKTQSVRIAGQPHERVVFVWPDNVHDEPIANSAAAVAELQSALPAVKTQNGIPYLSGGIGAAESAAIKADFSKHSLALTFANHRANRNEYLASVAVVILDASGGTVLDVQTDGPFLLVDLPAGSYRITATFREQQRQATVRVLAGKSVERAFVWAMESEGAGTP